MKTSLAVLFGLLLVSEGLAQEKVSVVVRSKKGDRISTTEKSSSTGTLNMVMGDQKNQMNFSEKGIEESVDEVLEVNEDGWRTRARRTVKKDREKKREPGNPEPEEKISHLEGKTFILSQDGEKTSYEEIPEGMTEVDMKGQDLRRVVFEKFLPREKVAIGHTWEIPEKDLLADFNKDQGGDDGGMKLTSGSAVGTLKSVDKGIAEVVYVVKMKGNGPNGMDASLDMTATALIDSGKARLVSVNGTGKMKLSGVMPQGDNNVQLDGVWDLKMSETYSYE